jgi:hypothetical protein
LGGVDVLPKTTLHVVSAKFDAPMPIDMTVQHYQRVLMSRGWRQVSMARNGSNINKVKFCKGDMDAILEFSVGSENSARYYFGVRWAGGRFSKTGCKD